ncbi:MAG: choice-of-anchor J domain-containing protein [Rhizobacter sp.]|nr:choice-of-anchor J domain-containing protein [Rhizobacter sp.]
MRSCRAAFAAGLVVLALAAKAQVVVNEGFDSVASLASSGWVLLNASTPLGTTGWFQGDPGIFPAFAGAANSYIAANFDNAQPGGTIANFLFSPGFTTQSGDTVSFLARSAGDPQFTDQIRVGRTTGGATAADFIQIGSDITLTDTWTQYSFTIGAQGSGGAGRAAIEYFGPADLRNYVGVDSFSVTASAVPEPGAWALMGIGLALAGALGRRPMSA